jgi:superfamily II DNA or RNA helicase
VTQPHDYQQNYLDAIAKGWADGFRRQLIDLPTGGGKTNVAAWEIAKALKRFERCLFLADQSDLVFQPAKRIEDLLGVKCDIEKAEFRANDADVVCASVQTLMRSARLESWPQDAFDLIIADEADKSISPSWKKVLNHFDGKAKVLGQTATPKRTDKKNLGIYYDNLIALESLQSLILKGFLSPIKILMLPIKIELPDVKGDYSDEEADEIITPHLKSIAEAIKEHAYFRKTLVFLPLIKTAKLMDEICKSIGLSSEYIYGDDPERADKMRRYERDEISVMSNAMVLTRGVDMPNVDCIIFARVTKSDTLVKQAGGRGTRVMYAPGVDIRDQASRIAHIASGPKPDCLFLDFLYQMGKRLKCRPAHLIAQTDDEADAITKVMEDASAALPSDVIAQLDLVQVMADVSSQREMSLRAKLEANKNKQAKVISAEEFAMKYNSLETAEFEPTMAWERKDLTPNMVKNLEKAGIDSATVRGFEHGTRLLNLYWKNKKLKLASHGQRATMKRMGFPNWEHATEAEAKQFFSSLNKRKEQPEMI